MSSDPKLFEVPRIGVIVDPSDPTILRVAFSGSVELDRGNAKQVALYNSLQAGEPVEAVVTAFVVGARKSHRLDEEGTLADVIEVKTLRVEEVFTGSTS